MIMMMLETGRAYGETYCLSYGSFQTAHGFGTQTMKPRLVRNSYLAVP